MYIYVHTHTHMADLVENKQYTSKISHPNQGWGTFSCTGTANFAYMADFFLNGQLFLHG